jgi:hypothetical protein
MQLLKTLQREFNRVSLLLALGLILILISPGLAEFLMIPALSPWGLFLGGSFFVAAMSHIMRRALFPKLDLQLIAIHAVKNNNIAAALIFLGVCVVLAAFLIINGSMLRI